MKKKLFLLVIVFLLNNVNALTFEYDELENKCYINKEEISCTEIVVTYDVCYGPGCF